MGFGSNLAGWRRRRGFTQAALAARAGMPQPNLAAMESERRDVTLRTLYRLGEALGLQPGDLLRPPPPPAQLDRHQLDALAEAVLTGRNPADPALGDLARGTRAALGPVLSAASGRRWSGRGARVTRRAITLWGGELLEQVRVRVVKRLSGGARRTGTAR